MKEEACLDTYCTLYDSPLGTISLFCDGLALTGLRFGTCDTPIYTEVPLFDQAKRQLDEYFAGRRRVFSIPLQLRGTDFQKQVWNALLTIPYGETRSYEAIAIAIENPQASRAIGMANNRNPIGIVIPCHRVIGKDGSLVGYGGSIEKKKALLDLEKRFSQDERG